MLKKIIDSRRKFGKDDGFVLSIPIVILIMFILSCGFGVFFIMSIQKIATGILMIGIAILAMGAGVMLLKKGWSSLSKGG